MILPRVGHYEQTRLTERCLALHTSTQLLRLQTDIQTLRGVNNKSHCITSYHIYRNFKRQNRLKVGTDKPKLEVKMQPVSDDDVRKRLVEKPRSFELAVKGVFRLGTCYILRQGRHSRSVAPHQLLDCCSKFFTDRKLFLKDGQMRGNSLFNMKQTQKFTTTEQRRTSDLYLIGECSGGESSCNRSGSGVEGKLEDCTLSVRSC